MILQDKTKAVKQETLKNGIDDKYQTTNLDHLGLIAAQFEDLGLVELLNNHRLEAGGLA